MSMKFVTAFLIFALPSLAISTGFRGASRKVKDVDDDGDEYEHGDASTSLDEDDDADSDFSTHQFLAPDEARDGPSDDEDNAEISQAAADDDDTFNSEDTPAADQDNFVQVKSVKKTGKQGRKGKKGSKHSKKKGIDSDDDDDEYEHGDAATSLDEDESADSDFSVHQFLAPDEARDGVSDDDKAEAESNPAESEDDDTFNSEDTPAEDQENFVQQNATGHVKRKHGHSKKGIDDDDDEYEHGDAATSLDEDESADSDFSTHQFLAPDDARDGPNDDDAKAEGEQMAPGEDDTFNSEDTPAEDQDSLVQK